MRIPRAAATTLAAVAATAVLAPASYADDCPNAEIRAKQKATQLGECRAYEMVSPTDKVGNQIDVKGTTMAAPSGDAVVYSAPGAFAGAVTSVMQAHYLGRRSVSGWSVDPVDPPQSNEVGTLGTPTRFFSESLDSAIQVSGAALAPGATEGGSNVYRRDNLTGARNLLATGPTPLLIFQMTDIQPRPWVAATPDLSRFLFGSATPLLPEAAPGVDNVYEVVGDELRLAGILPDGSVPPGGSQVSMSHGMDVNRAVSPERVFFTSPEGSLGALYMRENGVTRLISRSHRPGDDPLTPWAATFTSASDDGKIVYFLSDYQLTPDAPDGNQLTLYRYDTASDQLEVPVRRADPLGSHPYIPNVYAVAPDGSALYFFAPQGSVVSGESEGPALYRYDEDGTRLVAELPSLASGPPGIAVSPNLRYVVFQSWDQPTGFDNRDAECRYSKEIEAPDGLCAEIFVYDAVTDELACVSCVPGSSDNASAMLNPQFKFHSQYKPRAVLDDGRAFFTTAEGLVPRDVNGKRDVYVWQDGKLDLISSGRSEFDSTFAEASPDGESVFIVTGEQLVGVDRDDANDLYVARIDGGVGSQNERPATGPACDGDDCQRPSDAPPSLISSSPGNLGSPLSPDRRPVPPGVVPSAAPRGASIRLAVRVPARGVIRVSGPGLVTASRSVRSAGRYRVVVRLSRSARRKLARRNRLAIRTTVRFTSTQGLSSAKRLSLTFKAQPTRKGR